MRRRVTLATTMVVVRVSVVARVAEMGVLAILNDLFPHRSLASEGAINPGESEHDDGSCARNEAWERAGDSVALGDE